MKNIADGKGKLGDMFNFQQIFEDKVRVAHLIATTTKAVKDNREHMKDNRDHMQLNTENQHRNEARIQELYTKMEQM